jgi:hypothetical protein
MIRDTLKSITVVRPHAATNRELIALYQNIHKMALFFLLGATAEILAYPLPHC